MTRLYAILFAGSVFATACGPSENAGSSDVSLKPPVAPIASPSAVNRPETPTSERFSRIPPEQVDQERREAAEAFARGYEERRAQGTFQPLGEEASAEMRGALDPDKQRDGHQQIVAAFGDFRSLKYVETWQDDADPGSTIFRFRGTFSKDRPEIRVVHDAAGKVSGYWIKPWRDLLGAPQPQKIPEDQVDATLRQASMAFAQGFLEQRKAGRFDALGDQVTDELRAALTPDVQRRSHTEITARMGDYQSLTYVEAYRLEEDPGTTIFRFRATFTSGRPEVRVVLDADGKVSGFWIRPWQDLFG